jgi:serine/threonine protein kinase
LEYLPDGNVKEFLMDNKHIITPKHLIEMAITAANGMNFLHNTGVIHRDLAG